MQAGEVDLDLDMEVNMEKEMFGASSLLTMFVIERNRRWKWTDRWVEVEDEGDEEMDEVDEEEKGVGGCVDEEVDVCASREIHRKIWHNMLWAVWAHIIDTCH